MTNKENTIDKAKVFKFLDELRDSGTTNMMGAGAHIHMKFRCDSDTARELLFEWMDSK